MKSSLIKNVQVVCDVCGKKFLTSRRMIKKRETRGSRCCCSPSCSGHLGAVSMRGTHSFAGEDNPRWKGGVSRKHIVYKNRSIAKYPEKHACRQQFQSAIRAGVITRGCCEICGAQEAHGHHEDYSQPFVVRWLCQRHHNELHAGKIQLNEMNME